MGGSGGMLLASTTTLLMPSLPGALSRLTMDGLVLVKRTVPLIWLGFRMTWPFSEAVPATEQSRLNAAKDKRFGFIQWLDGLPDSTRTVDPCQHFIIYITLITDRWHERSRTRNVSVNGSAIGWPDHKGKRADLRLSLFRSAPYGNH